MADRFVAAIDGTVFDTSISNVNEPRRNGTILRKRTNKKPPRCGGSSALSMNEAYGCLGLADVGSLELAVLAGGDVKLDSLALVQSLEAVHLDLGVVDEQVVAVLARDEAVALVRVEPLNSTLCHVVPFFLAPRGENSALYARYKVWVLATRDILPQDAGKIDENPFTGKIERE